MPESALAGWAARSDGTVSFCTRGLRGLRCNVAPDEGEVDRFLAYQSVFGIFTRNASKNTTRYVGWGGRFCQTLILAMTASVAVVIISLLAFKAYSLMVPPFCRSHHIPSGMFFTAFRRITMRRSLARA